MAGSQYRLFLKDGLEMSEGGIVSIPHCMGAGLRVQYGNVHTSVLAQSVCQAICQATVIPFQDVLTAWMAVVPGSTAARRD